ncbi:MAG: PDZ domain-containing protein, partial [Brevundimonas sp.]|nr:PDZ domain-containing protein [Brevundimonas sp.]
GALVTQVADGGAAHRRGVRAGDMIVRVDSTDVAAASSPIDALADAMALRGCADGLAVTLLRDGATVQMSIVRAEP